MTTLLAEPVNQTIQDNATGIRMSLNAPIGVSLRAEKFSDGDKLMGLPGSGLKRAYDIRLNPENLTAHAGTLSIPVEKGFDISSAKLYKKNGSDYVETGINVSSDPFGGKVFIIPVTDFTSATYAVADASILPTDISFKKTALTLGIGETATLEIDVKPAGANCREIGRASCRERV